jgi:hypothetical protein
MRTVFLSITAFSIGLGLAAGSAEDQQPSPAPQPTSATPASDKDKLICRYMYHEGTLIRTQSCHTQREWDAERIYNQRQLNEAQQRGMTSSPR